MTFLLIWINPIHKNISEKLIKKIILFNIKRKSLKSHNNLNNDREIIRLSYKKHYTSLMI